MMNPYGHGFENQTRIKISPTVKNMPDRIVQIMEGKKDATV